MTQAFDHLATTYDNNFTYSVLGRWLRNVVHNRLATHFNTGSYVLELGCGTGEDAQWLAQKGVNIWATDSSTAMLNVAKEKNRDMGNIQFAHLDLHHPQLPASAPESFDGVFANFGPINVLEDTHSLAQWLAQYIKSGGRACFGVMSPFCLWETLWHGAHLNWKIAGRRWRGKSSFIGSDGNVIPVYYPSIRQLTQSFAPYFRRIYLRPLGLFLPPSDVYGVIEKRPKLLKVLLSLEKRIGHIRQLSLFADHYWIEFERV